MAVLIRFESMTRVSVGIYDYKYTFICINWNKRLQQDVLRINWIRQILIIELTAVVR